MKKQILLLIAICAYISVIAQSITVSIDTVPPEQTILNKFIPEGINAFNITYTGDSLSFGLFESSNSGFDSLIHSGLVLSNGSVLNLSGPNSLPNSSYNNGFPGDTNLSELAYQITYNASIIEFDFIPSSSYFKFRYIFGSDEYPEYANSSFQDIFAFLLTGPKPNGGTYTNQNIALIPGTNTSVRMYNINNGNNTPPHGPCKNCWLYIDNSEIANSSVEMDGFTTPIQATANVIPGETYHMKLAIADCFNSEIDSWILLEDNTNPVNPLSPYLIPQPNWVFGTNNAVIWRDSSNNLIPYDTVSNNITIHQTSCLSDINGNLLFVSDGLKLMDADYNVLPNGNFLTGGTSLIIPKPHDPLTFYLFTVDETYYGARYSKIDMSLNGSNGDIDPNEKNLILAEPFFHFTTNKISSTVHQNGEDIWVIVHNTNTDFYSFLVNSNGIDLVSPVISSIGSVHNGVTPAKGHMKLSPSGHKLAVAIHCNHIFEIFDFDKSTGIISNHVLLSNSDPVTFQNAYGVEFSPDEKYLYGTNKDGTVIHQWDVSLSSNTAIVNSHQIVVSDTINGAFGALQIGPDGYIYIARYNETYLSRLTDPNMISGTVGFESIGTVLPNNCQYDLPNFMTGTFNPQSLHIAERTDSVSCYGLSDGTAEIEAYFGVPPYIYYWYDYASGNKLENIPSGWYQYVVADAIGETVSGYINVLEPQLLSFEAEIKNVSCYDGNNGEVIITPKGGTSPYTYIWDDGNTTNQINNKESGTYLLTITDYNSCVAVQNVLISQPDPILISSVISSASGSNESDGSIDLSLSGGTPPFSFMWNNGETTEDISMLAPGIYAVAILDANDCYIIKLFEVKYPLSSEHYPVVDETTNLHAYPNPFTEKTIIGFSLIKSSYVKLNVYDLFGKKIRTLIDSELNTGKHNIEFESNSPGIFMAKLNIDGFEYTEKLVSTGK